MITPGEWKWLVHQKRPVWPRAQKDSDLQQAVREGLLRETPEGFILTEQGRKHVEAMP